VCKVAVHSENYRDRYYIFTSPAILQPSLVAGKTRRTMQTSGSLMLQERMLGVPHLSFSIQLLTFMLQLHRGRDLQALHQRHTPAAKPPPHNFTPSLPPPIAQPAVITKPPNWPQRYPHCYTDECIGCTCMCPNSDEWFEHPDGHFFPTYTWCGHKCPGCRCVCPKSEV
jgi:hypothetical protein